MERKSADVDKLRKLLGEYDQDTILAAMGALGPEEVVFMAPRAGPPCDQRLIGLRPVFGIGSDERGARKAARQESHRFSTETARLANCDAKDCDDEHMCVYDYGVLMLDVQQRNFRTAGGRQMTFWLARGLHMFGCFCTPLGDGQDF